MRVQSCELRVVMRCEMTGARETVFGGLWWVAARGGPGAFGSGQTLQGVG